MPVTHPEQARRQTGIDRNAHSDRPRMSETATNWAAAAGTVIATVSLVVLVIWLFGT